MAKKKTVCILALAVLVLLVIKEFAVVADER
jgi:hypothetical protein